MDITVKKLSKKYGDKIVFDDFSVTFESGKVTVIMGKSGSGKTTLLNCIAGLTGYDGEIDGISGVSYVFQDDRLIPNLTVYDNLDITVEEPDKEIKNERIKNILSALDLTDKAAKLPAELSGGEKKRVALARAFLSRGNLMLLDEPLNSLDIGLKRRVDEYFLDIVKKENKTAIYVTHDLDETLFVADAVTVIGDGGAVWSYKFVTDKSERKITDEESVAARAKLIELLY